MLCGLESQSDIGSYDNDRFACKIDMFHRGYLPPLLLDVLEETDSSHDFEHNVEGDFTRCPALVLDSPS